MMTATISYPDKECVQFLNTGPIVQRGFRYSIFGFFCMIGKKSVINEAEFADLFSKVKTDY